MTKTLHTLCEGPGPFNIQVGVSVNLFVKKHRHQAKSANIFYNGETAELPKEATFEFLEACEHIGNVNWDSVQPDARYTWLTEGLREDFETFLPIGSKQAKAKKDEISGVIFHQFSNGVKTNRDAWAINFDEDALSENVIRMIDTYNTQTLKWQQQTAQNVDDFVVYDNEKISWSSGLKQKLISGYIHLR